MIDISPDDKKVTGIRETTAKSGEKERVTVSFSTRVAQFHTLAVTGNSLASVTGPW